MKTNPKTETELRGRKDNPIELVEAQVLNGEIIILSEKMKEKGDSLKTGIKAFYMALKN